MEANGNDREKLDRVAHEMGGAIRRQVRRKWDTVRTAERNERGRHVWRFQSGPEGGDRYLHVTHEAMGLFDAPQLLERLRAGHWLSRLSRGPEKALVLGKEGRLEPLDA
jgi:hypothetical protein